MLSALFVMLIVVVVAYIGFRKLLTFKRQQRLKKLGASRAMFRDMDTDSSGRITRNEMRNSLAVLGLEVSSQTAIQIIESIDIDHSGDIDEHEFVAWMEYNVSRFKMALVVGKIMLGLVQVLSKQPTVLKESFPGPQWESVCMKFWSFDFGWVFPVCRVNYYERFLLNAVVLPVFLMGLVKLTWAMNTRATKKEEENETPDGEADREIIDKTIWQAEIRRVFEEVDADGTGQLDRSEVNRLAERLGERLSEGDLETAMLVMDGNGDGHVGFEEFACWYDRMRGKDDDNYDESKASRRSDYYFAFFLCCE
jgi:Ca2+-binding EF-hand superfamily protein